MTGRRSEIGGTVSRRLRVSPACYVNTMLSDTSHFGLWCCYEIIREGQVDHLNAEWYEGQ